MKPMVNNPNNNFDDVNYFNNNCHDDFDAYDDHDFYDDFYYDSDDDFDYLMTMVIRNMTLVAIENRDWLIRIK
ncbi:hypothetical protein RhiirA5_429117 [Rhizophagus irregularis]|uniref:Uncharacterized protein n=1 Tax=Rhizophagus irregularis TaxID=588596 RepID=A0A2N0QYU5_9GLOM|nr:hypothetical protein RhiirA5_429117 [Rhizophagus irregularis]PKC56223.1 hypothetical protein RhiirA1_474306 [Rhizophagus irregularis]